MGGKLKLRNASLPLVMYEKLEFFQMSCESPRNGCKVMFHQDAFLSRQDIRKEYQKWMTCISPIFIAYLHVMSTCQNGDNKGREVFWFNDLGQWNLTQLCQVYRQRLMHWATPFEFHTPPVEDLQNM